MRILLVGGFSDDSQEVESLDSLYDYTARTLPDAQVDRIFLNQITYRISKDSYEAYGDDLSNDLSVYDAIYIRGPKMRIRSEQAYYLSRFCEFNDIRCINDYSLYYPGTKIAQAGIFAEESLLFPVTLYTKDNRILVRLAESEFGYPFILKTTSGSHGDANYLIKSEQDVENALLEDVDFMAQEFCPNDRDYRVLVTKDDSLVFARKGSSDTHLNNTSKGAEAFLAETNEVPVEIIESSRRIASRLKLEIAGVDVMPNLENGNFYFLEINSQPQLVTGAFLDQKADLFRSIFS